MPLIQEAKTTFQQFEKWIIFFCFTSIFKTELKWEIPIFHDFTSHTLCKYVHHHGLHLSQLKPSWTERCPAHAVWMWAWQEHTGRSGHKRHHGTSREHGHQHPSSTTPEYWQKMLLPLLTLSSTKIRWVCLPSTFQIFFHFSYRSRALWESYKYRGTFLSLTSVLSSNSHSTPRGESYLSKHHPHPFVPLWQ